MALKRAMKEAILDLSLGISKISPEDNDTDDWDEYTPRYTLAKPSVMVVEARVVGLYTLLHSYRCNPSCFLFLLSSALTAGI